MKNKLIKPIIIVVFIIILLLVSIIFLSMKNNNKKEKEQKQEEKTEEYKEEKSFSEDIDVDTYFMVKQCIDTYYNSIYYLSHGISSSVEINDGYKEYQAKVLLSLLNEQFIDENKIEVENIIDNYFDYDYREFIIKKLYSINNKNNENLLAFLAYGEQIDVINKKTNNYGLIILMDKNNKTFSVMPYEYMKKIGFENYKDTLDIEKINIPKNINVSDNNTNLYTQLTLNDEDIVRFIFKDYRIIVQNDPEYAYDLLEKDYKDKRFENEQSGLDFFSNEFDNLFGYRLTKMAVNNDYSKYTEYICQDSNENYFIIRKDKQYMKYSILLDAYTVPINQFVLKYRNGNNARKTALNLEKFKQMINLKDYKSAYNVLDENFRNNNFGSVEKFEQYVKENWPEYISLNYNNYQDAGDVGTISVNIVEKGVPEIELMNTISKTFIMKLIDENNFVMSFNMD